MEKTKIGSLQDLDLIKRDYLQMLAGYKYQVLVCGGTGCVSANCAAVEESFRKLVAEKGLENDVKIIKRGCMGTCAVGPVVFILPDEAYYTEVTPERVERIVEQHLIGGKVVSEYTFYDAVQKKRVDKMYDAAFFHEQVRIALRNCGLIDVTNVDAYIARDGYMAIAKALANHDRQGIIDTMVKSGLRGRGGGGFPTGVKWAAGAKSPGPQKYIICNADEGDPGAFMDRSVFEGDPHSVIEGMMLGGYAIGANQGFVYIRAEYPIALERLNYALDEARSRGLLGKNIMGSGFDFDIEVRIGAGAFVCGEETALMASVEGRRGEPKQKPPFPAESGLFGKPTIINNVESLANVPAIILNGADWFRQYGTPNSPGTKVFAMTGKIENSGLVEVPMGISLGTIIFDMGGGIPNGKKFKSAQTGGPSGGCITAENLNASMDYDTLISLGSMMGSGGLIVMDEDTCMVDTARYYMDFIVEESCGKCAACRIGTRQMLTILENITQGKGQPGDIELLEELGHVIKDTAMCGLGQTAPNPVLSTIKYFREEYEEHIYDKHCRAGVCRELLTSPCQNNCPADINIPGYMALVATNQMDSAYRLMLQENPFSGICGRVCTHPCESRCRRGTVDEPLQICEMKRFVTDHAYAHNLPLVGELDCQPSTGKKIAVIGAGPSGLTCAYYLQRLGHQVDVLESEAVPGGVMMWGIPEYRLPKDIVRHEISIIESVGVNIKLNTKVGKDITFAQLKEQYDAVYIAIGAQKAAHLKIEGEDLEGVYHGLEFLKYVGLKKTGDLTGKTVAVIGGGNTAIDSARTAIRLGADKVTILYRRTQATMPAAHEEIEDALAEGVEIMEMVNPIRFKGSNGKVESVVLLKQEFGDFDSSGRKKSKSIAESEFEFKADVVIPAVSQAVDTKFVSEAGINTSPWRTIQSDVRTMATNQEGVFAGGDAQRGPQDIVHAIHDAKLAAGAIDCYLGGTGKLYKGDEIALSDFHPEGEIFAHARYPKQTESVEKCCSSFCEVNKGFHRLDAIAESMRCLRCDRREA